MAKTQVYDINADFIMKLFGSLQRVPYAVVKERGQAVFIYPAEDEKGNKTYIHVAVPLGPNEAAPQKPAANDTVVKVRIGPLDGDADSVTFAGLTLKFAALGAGAGLTDSNARYAFWVSLLDGDVAIKGGRSDIGFAELEVGKGGTATVTGGSGVEKLHVWHEKNVRFDGLGGADIISFISSYGDPYATKPVRQLIVNLERGTGQNPYGGTLSLRNVENVVGTANADRIIGTNGANVIGDAYDTGADVISARGGDDTIKLGSGGQGGAVVDGGAGMDELSFLVNDLSTASSRIVLDIANPSANTFVFANGRYTNIEKITAGSGGFANDTDIFVFGGGDAGETVTGTTVFRFVGAAFRPFVGRDELSGRAGNDVLKGLAGLDRLEGGAGDDTLIGGADADVLRGDAGTDTASYEDALEGVAASLAAAGSNKGDAKGDTYGSIENLSGSFYADTLAGDARANTLAGKEGNDILGGGKGADGFLFDTPLDAAANIDRINDFLPKDDAILLEKDVFAPLGKPGRLAAGHFKDIGVAGAKEDADDRIVYNRKTGDLSYDADGSGDGAAILFARIENKAALTAADFLVV